MSKYEALELALKKCYNDAMKCDQIVNLLKKNQGRLRQAGAQHLYLFGSSARNAARRGSDVDIFIDYKKGEFGLFELMDFSDLAAGILGRKVDAMTRDSIYPGYRKDIEASAIKVF